MNRRQLFKGALGVLATAIMPLPALAVAEPFLKKDCDIHLGVHRYLPNHLTPSQYERVKNLYGGYEEFASVGDDYAVGYSHHWANITEGTDSGTWVTTKVYLPVEDRADHMFLGKQMFHGSSWEEAIVYAETYKIWLKETYYNNGISRHNHVHKVVGNDAYWYSTEATMTAGVDKLSWTDWKAFA